MSLAQAPNPYAWYFSTDFALVVVIGLMASIVLTKLVKNLFNALEDRWEEGIFWGCAFVLCTIATNVIWINIATRQS